MHFNSKLILTLLFIISTALATLNDKCSGRTGICIKTSTCSSYGGQTFSGKCPSDPNDVKCCDYIPCNANGKSGNCVFSGQCSGESFSGLCPGGSDFKCCVGKTTSDDSSGSSGSSASDAQYNGPCSGGGGACININNMDCETQTVAGRCSGPNNIRCCVAGNRPSWYINQGEHTDIICRIPGSNPENKTVKSSGCGVSCLSMALKVVKNNNVTPETLFKEGFNNGKYLGDGFSHEALTFLGKIHGAKVTWTSSTDTVFNALENGKGVIFNVGPESKYHFTSYGHYIFLYGAKKQKGVQKVYVFDPNGGNKYINVLFPLRKSDGGIEVAKRGFGGDFGIVE